MALRLRSTKSVRIQLGEDDWLEVKPELTKGEFRDVVRKLPDDVGQEGARLTYDDSENFLESVFERMVTGWSVTDEDGTSVAPTLENLLLLPQSHAQIIERALMDHFNKQEPDASTATKSDGDSGEPSVGVLDEVKPSE